MFKIGDICTVSNDIREFHPDYHYLLGQKVEITGEKYVGKYPVKLLFDLPKDTKLIAKAVREDLLFKD
jgi:hypothetical protein